jgi:hypothetical protein
LRGRVGSALSRRATGRRERYERLDYLSRLRYEPVVPIRLDLQAMYRAAKLGIDSHLLVGFSEGHT